MAPPRKPPHGVPPTVPPQPGPEAPRDEDAHDGFSDSDQAWFDQLAGRPAAVPSAAAQREAELLREALAARAETARAGEPAAAEQTTAERQWQRVQRKIAAAQAVHASQAAQAAAPATPPQRAPANPPAPRPAAGLAPTPRRQPTRPGLWSRWRDALFGGGAAWPARWGAVAALAGVAGLAVVLVPQLVSDRDIDGPPLEPGMVLKGGPEQGRVQRITSATPRRDAEAFAAALRAAGLRPGVFRDADAAAGSVVFVDLDIEAGQAAAAAKVFEARQLKRPAEGFARVVFARR
jgi:hypothetical protein